MKTKQLDNRSVLFVADTSFWSQKASKLIKKYFPRSVIIFWNHGTLNPPDITNWQGDWIICFKSDYIIPKSILTKVKFGAINFHPAPPKYRGIGGYYHALENGDKSYAVTCHHMIERVDYGNVITVREFTILKNESPLSLKDRAGAYCLTLFYEILSLIINNKELPVSKINWDSKLYTYRDLIELKKRNKYY